MNRYSLAFAAAALAALLPLLQPAPAAAAVAQPYSETFVSSAGSIENDCGPREKPCLNIFSAIENVAPGGEVHCLDDLSAHSGFGIPKSVTIVCNKLNNFTGISVNSPAGSIITLKGLIINCTGVGNVFGLNISEAVVVHVIDVQVRNCNQAGQSGISVTLGSGVAEVYVSDSLITGNGTTTTTAGILIKPTGSASVRVQIERTLVENNANGIVADARGGTGGIRGVIRDTVVAGNTTYGVLAQSAGATVNLLLSNVTIQSNQVGLAAVGASGAPALYVDHSQITANGTGLAASGVGKIFSYGNNNLGPNATNGAFSGVIAVK